MHRSPFTNSTKQTAHSRRALLVLLLTSKISPFSPLLRSPNTKPRSLFSLSMSLAKLSSSKSSLVRYNSRSEDHKSAPCLNKFSSEANNCSRLDVSVSQRVWRFGHERVVGRTRINVRLDVVALLLLCVCGGRRGPSLGNIVTTFRKAKSLVSLSLKFSENCTHTN